MKEKDGYWRRAKKEGYRARSAYKLLELSKKYNLIKKGDRVLDIGAAPGSWIQVCLKLVEEGRVYGIDITPIRGLDAETITADIMKEDILDKIDGKFDVVISDIAPNTTGIKEIDSGRSEELSERAFWIAENVLVKNGNFLCKVFQSEENNELLTKIKKRFDFVKMSKPTASKKRSKEIYIIAKYFK